MKHTGINSLLTTIGQDLHTNRNENKETLQVNASKFGFTHSNVIKTENRRYLNIVQNQQFLDKLVTVK